MGSQPTQCQNPCNMDPLHAFSRTPQADPQQRLNYVSGKSERLQNMCDILEILIKKKRKKDI